MIRVLIADDHPIVREGFGAIVSAEADVEVVAEVGDGAQAVEAALQHRPDIVLMDLRMPKLNGVDAIRRLSETCPGVKTIVLTTYDDDEYVYDAIRAGARGYLLKDVPPPELVRAIRTVHAGGSLLQPVAVQKLLDRLGPEGRAESQAPLEDLTPREIEVLGEMARGARNREIAQALVISERTVKIHVANIIAKLGARNRTEAVVKALDSGLVGHHD